MTLAKNSYFMPSWVLTPASNTFAVQIGIRG